jgi:hypothetical protein
MGFLKKPEGFYSATGDQLKALLVGMCTKGDPTAVLAPGRFSVRLTWNSLRLHKSREAGPPWAGLST